MSCVICPPGAEVVWECRCLGASFIIVMWAAWACPHGGAEGGSRHCVRDLWLHWPRLHVGLIDVLRARVGQEVINK